MQRIRYDPDFVLWVAARSRAPFYRWFSGGELNACYNALGEL